MGIVGSQKTVLIFGGTGYVGKAILQTLLKHNFTPLVFARKNSKEKIPEEIKSQCVFYEGEMEKLAAYTQDFARHKPLATIYLIGILKEKPKFGITFQKLHYEWAVEALKICQTIGCKKFLYMSANGAKAVGTPYQTFKFKMEEYLAQSRFPFVVFRPSIILGPDSAYHFMTVIKQLMNFPIIPIFGSGNFRLTPVYRYDVGEAYARAIKNDSISGKVLLLGGDTTVSYLNLIRMVVQHFHKKLFFVHLPLRLSKIGVKLMEKIPFAPITSDQFKMLIEENFIIDQSAWKLLGITPKSLSEIIDEY